MKKAIIVLMSVVLLSCAVAIPSNAAMPPEDTVQPLWDNTSNIDCTVAAVDGIGYAECVVIARSGSSSIKTDIYVYEAVNNVWTYQTEAHSVKYHVVAGTSCPFSVSIGCHYRADYTFTVTRNGIDEVIQRTVYYTYEG